MSEQQGLDIGKVVSLIMENPALIEQIANLAKQQGQNNENTENNLQSIPEEAQLPDNTESRQTVSQPTYRPPTGKSNNRSQLLGALKPYVSSERAKAIDSMISIANVLDMMKTR